MSKKLLIAVLTLGCLFTLGGAALTSDTNPAEEGELKFRPDRSLINLETDVRATSLNTDLLQKPVADPAITRDIPDGRLAIWPPPYGCEVIDYTGGYFDIAIPVPYPAYDADIWMNRFVSTASGNIGGTVECTVKTAYIGIMPDWSVGDPDMVVIVYDYPNEADGSCNERGRVTVPFASLPAPGSGPSFVSVDLTTADAGGPVLYTDGAAFRIAVTTSDPANDTLFILSEDVPSYPGGSMLRFCSPSLDPPGCWWWFGSGGPQLNIAAEVCCADLGFSECHTLWTCCPTASWYSWWSPDWAGYRGPWANRFFVDGPETLTTIGVAATTFSGAPDMAVFVWGDAAGLPDESNLIYSTTRDNSLLVDFDYTVTMNSHNVFDVKSQNLVFRDDFHIGVDVDHSTWVDGDTIKFWSDDDGGLCSYHGSSLYMVDWAGMDPPFTGWMLFADRYPIAFNMNIFVEMCKDEFSLCQTISDYCADYYIYSLPNSGANGRIACYQQIDPADLGCRLEEFRIMLYMDPYYSDPDPPFNYSSEVEIRWSDGTGVDGAGDPVEGVPGTLIWSTTIPAGESNYNNYPAWNEWDVMADDIKFDGPIWIGIKTNAPWDLGHADYFVNADDASCPTGRSIGYYNDGVDEWWVHFAVNFWIEADVCCIPPAERACVPEVPPDPNWPTCGHDFRRTGASFNSVGDAQCKQAVSWWRNDPNGFGYNRPVIYDGIVLASYNDKLQAFDINGDGTTPLWTVIGLPYIGAGFRNTPTVVDGYVYFGGGNARSFNKYDVYTGGKIWNRGITNQPFVGNTVYTSPIVLDCEGDKVIFLTTTAGEVYAIDDVTGNNYAGWAVNPVMVDGDPLHTLSSNGVDMLYVGTDGAYGDGNGTFYAINACDGSIAWSRGYPDFEGEEISGVDPPGEIFQAPTAVDLDGSIYTISGIWFDNTSATPSGVYYKMDANGNILWAKGARFPRYAGPIIDANLVYFTSLRFWTSEIMAIQGLVKTNGSTQWTTDPFYDNRCWVEGALSCEPLQPDLLYMANYDAQFVVVNGDDGVVEFEYAYDPIVSNRGTGIAIDPEHVVMTNLQGDMFVMTNQVDRPRLRILVWDELASVPFFSPSSFIVTFDEVFMNNGCANLTGSISLDEEEPDVYSVTPDRIARMHDAASSLIDYTFEDMAKNLVKGQKVDMAELDDEFAESPYAKDSYSNTAAYGPPAWLNSIVTPTFDLAPGEAFDVVYDVNGPLVTRGPHYAYLSISSNDQYYLNVTDDPYVQMGVLGGCLEVDDVMYFGVGEANQAPVFNTGEQGNQNGAALWTFDGEDSRYWQGGFFFGTDQYELAWTTDSWHGADPPDYWCSLLPDPNCFDQCEPYVLEDPVLLGQISHDGGQSYDDIEGYVSVAAYVDSVIDFDCYGTGWDWSNTDCPFDNDLTIGLWIQQFMYAAIDDPALANVVIYRHDITNRNADPISDLGMGAFHDFDLDGSWNGFDAFKFSADYGIAYGSPCAEGYEGAVCYGVGTIPMIMRGAHTCDANQAMWHADNIWLDSAYYYMANVTGQTAQAGIVIEFPCAEETETDDRDLWASFMLRDFAGEETYSFGTYFFGYENADITDDQFFYDLAKLVNQFAGFDRGDIDDDGDVDLADAVALWNMVNAGGNGPLFYHLADVNADGGVDNGDVLYLANYYFNLGPAPVGDWVLPNICP